MVKTSIFNRVSCQRHKSKDVIVLTNNNRQLKCPSCGATFFVEDGMDSYYCSYCGEKVFIQRPHSSGEKGKHIFYHKTITDEAKIKKIELEERAQTITLVDRISERISSGVSVIGFIILTIILICIFVATFASAKAKSDRQERELQTIVDTVMQDIENGNFEEAYISAESIRYTAGWSDEIEKKWDAIRKETIDQIEKAEKQANGDSDGAWWDIFG